MYCNWKLVDSQPTFNCLQWSVNWLMFDRGLINGIYRGYPSTLNHRYLNYARSRLSRMYQVLCEYVPEFCVSKINSRTLSGVKGWITKNKNNHNLAIKLPIKPKKKSCTLPELKKNHTHSTEEKKACYEDWNKISWKHTSGGKNKNSGAWKG